MAPKWSPKTEIFPGALRAPGNDFFLHTLFLQVRERRGSGKTPLNPPFFQKKTRFFKRRFFNGVFSIQSLELTELTEHALGRPSVALRGNRLGTPDLWAGQLKMLPRDPEVGLVNKDPEVGLVYDPSLRAALVKRR